MVSIKFIWHQPFLFSLQEDVEERVWLKWMSNKVDCEPRILQIRLALEYV